MVLASGARLASTSLRVSRSEVHAGVPAHAGVARLFGCRGVRFMQVYPLTTVTQDMAKLIL